MGWYKPGSSKPIQLTEFAPDKNSLDPGILLDAVGAMPSFSGFTPMANLVGLAAALGGRPVGSYLAFYSDESTTVFAAIDTGSGVSFFVLSTALNAWVAVTGPTVNPAVPVRFGQFGDDVMVVGNFSVADGVWIAPNKASNFVTIPGSPDFATVIVVAGLQVVVFVNDSWFSSAAGDDTDWVLSLATRADTGVLADTPGPVVAASALFRNIIAFKKNVTYLGQQGFPSAWNWDVISTQTGTWSQGCVIQMPDAVAFLGMDDFYMTTGYTPQRIPNSCKQWFFRNVNPAYITNTLGWYDQSNSILYWHFVSREAPNPPTCDRFVSYNTRARRWCVGRLDVSSIPYLGQAQNSLPNPNTPAIIINGDFIPQAFTKFPSNMVLTTGYYGDPGRLSQVMRILPLYDRYPCKQTLTPLCTDVLGQPDKQSEPAVLEVDGWFYTRQYERYHKFIIGMEGDCEITAIVPEFRMGGLWGYGVDVPCPEINLTVESQFNPTTPTGDKIVPKFTTEGVVSGEPPVVTLGTGPGIEMEIAACPAEAPGAQNLAVEHCYDIDTGIPPGTLPGNTAASMNFVTGDIDAEDFVAIVTAQGVGTVPYPQVGAYNAVEATGETLASITPLPLPGGRTADYTGTSAGTGRQGHADNRAVLHSLVNLSPSFMGQGTVMAYFNYDDNTVTLFTFAPDMFPGTWAKRGNRLWHLAAPTGVRAIVRYDVATGGAYVATANINAICASRDDVRSLQGTDAYLYASIRGAGASKIYRLHQDTMAVIDTFDVVASTPNILSTYVVNDDLIFIWNQNSATVWGFYYLVPSTGIVTLIDTVTSSCTVSTFDQSGQLALHYNKSHFYLSYGGFGTGAPNITKIGPLVCPTNPNIPWDA